MHRRDVRYSLDIPANIVVTEGEPRPARLVNLSLHGFRVLMAGTLPAGQHVRLEVTGWPRMQANVVWSDGGRTAFLFQTPPTPDLFTVMCATVTDTDRDLR